MLCDLENKVKVTKILSDFVHVPTIMVMFD